MKIVIIEDEPKSAKDLVKTILSVSDEAEIIHCIETVEEGKSYFENTKDIDLIFSDIQLGDGLSFEIFENQDLQIPIIFCTAYTDYALQAFKTFGIDYILKPFSKTTIQTAIEKYKTLTLKNNSTVSSDYSVIIKNLAQHFSPKKKSNSLLVYRGDKIIPIEVDIIALLCTENSIVYAVTFDDKKMATSYKLDDLEQKLYPSFFRANRQFLINRKAIKEASRHFHRKLQAHLNIPFSEPVLIGKEKTSAFLDWLTN